MSSTPKNNSCKDKFLYFSPSEKDISYFTDSLIYICDHNSQGSMGVVLNRATNIKTEDLFNSLKLDIKDSLKQENLLLGGPVNPDAVFVLHSDPLDWKSSIKVSEKIALTTSGDILEAIAIGDGPDSYLIILGYSGWNPGQLEEELSENSWIEIPKDFDIIFNTPSKDQIDVLSKKIGFNLRMVSPDFGNA
ncbi:MAG: YqgE/AlgH family protein [Gammaproteobacteria bacterium]